MNYWHEPIQSIGRWVFHVRESRVASVFEGKGQDMAWQGHFLRYEGEEARPLRWDRKPDGWFELWPHELITAHSFNEARALVTPLFAQVEGGFLDLAMEKRPYLPPARPRRVKVIDHPSYCAKAIILEHPDGKFEVRYFVCLPEGEGLPALTPSIGEAGWDWCREGTEIAIFADDLEIAEKVGADELDQVARECENVRRRRHRRTV
jgi:hypothetical protein